MRTVFLSVLVQHSILVDCVKENRIVATFIFNQTAYISYRILLGAYSNGEHFRMKRAHLLFLSLSLIAIILTATAPMLFSYTQNSNTQKDPVYIGIAFCGNKTIQAEMLIDQVKNYTNLFVLDCGINPISKNLTAAREICDYAVKANLSIIVNLGTWTGRGWLSQLQFYNESRFMYGDKFLGAYYDDEPAGVELDWNWQKFFNENNSLLYGSSNLSMKDIYSNLQMHNASGTHPDNYTKEAVWFNTMLEQNRGHNYLKQNNFTTFTSDYTLYWFDYQGGYSTILAQFGWNASVNHQISLVRGAATLHNKDWGAILTWKYQQPPYLDSPENIYSQMKTAYDAGAKYIILFNYPQIGDNPYGGAMTNEHLTALQNFWTQIATKSAPNSASAEAALVLPKDYGWGMRSANDKIWGYWGPDDKSPVIWSNFQTLLSQYGSRLDVVYDDPAFPLQGNYSKVYWWNQTL
jgi:hypothetical protein